MTFRKSIQREIVFRATTISLLIAFSWGVLPGLTENSSTADSKGNKNDPTGITKLIVEVMNMEQQIVGSAPENEPFDERLAAIETKLFGEPQTGGLLQRVGRIAAEMQKCKLAASESPAGQSDLQDGQNGQTGQSRQIEQIGQTKTQATTNTQVAPSAAPLSPASSASAQINAPPSPYSGFNDRQNDGLAWPSDATAQRPSRLVEKRSTTSTDTTGVLSDREAHSESTQNPVASANGSKIAAVAATGTTPHAVAGTERTPKSSDPGSMDWPLDDDISKLVNATAAAVNKNITLQGGVSDVIDATLQRMKKEPDNVVSAAASKAYKESNFKLAKQLYDLLCQRRPRDPRNFYASGLASQAMLQSFDAFPDFVIAWHLQGNNPTYLKAADANVQDLQKGVDWSFKLTYGYNAQQPEAVLNAGTRCFKGGLVAQSMQLFEYALRNESPYRQVAAYNIGAIEESLGNPKVALTYYQWAEKEARRLQAMKNSLLGEHDNLSANAIQNSLNIASPESIAQAIGDVQRKLLRGDASWHGWTTPTSLPANAASEVCPLCIISRSGH